MRVALTKYSNVDHFVSSIIELRSILNHVARTCYNSVFFYAEVRQIEPTSLASEINKMNLSRNIDIIDSFKIQKVSLWLTNFEHTRVQSLSHDFYLKVVNLRTAFLLKFYTFTGVYGFIHSRFFDIKKQNTVNIMNSMPICMRDAFARIAILKCNDLYL